MPKLSTTSPKPERPPNSSKNLCMNSMLTPFLMGLVVDWNSRASSVSTSKEIQ